MIKCEQMWELFRKYDFNYFTGVPDSTFKEWMAFLDDNDGKGLCNRVAAIERDAIGWAAGYHAATGRVGVVYMQNSGLGNTINPLTSLADSKVYNIPILLMIGWRGEPGKHDEPQHAKMGEVTLPLLDVLGIKHQILPAESSAAENALIEAKSYFEQTNGIYAFIVQNNTFEEYTKNKKNGHDYEMDRETAIKLLADSIGNHAIIVSTTGKASRELFEHRESTKSGHQNDFLMVGSMGLASVFGAEIALQKPMKNVYIFDGDGAALMSASALSTIGHHAPKNHRTRQ